jgi:uncharacterized protein YdaU (DUF1376 family)
MANAPWFKFFPSDWLLSRTVRLMTAEQRGIYIQLLCEQWYGCNGLPSDEKALIQLAGCTADEWARSSESILEQFPTDRSGRRYNKKLRAMQNEARALSQERSGVGKRGNAKRWGSNGIVNRNCDTSAIANESQTHRDSDSDSDSDSDIDSDSDSEKAGGTLSRSDPPVNNSKSSQSKANSKTNGNGNGVHEDRKNHLARAIANKFGVTATDNNLLAIAEGITTEAIVSRCSEFDAAEIITKHTDPAFGGKSPRFYFEDSQWRAEPSYALRDIRREGKTA